MFDDVLVVYTAWDAAKAFSQLLVPVCRKFGYDDVLPDPPEYLQHQQYTILRAPTGGSDGDASNKFVGGLQHDGMVVLSSKQLPHTLVLPSPGGFPWHPLCEQFTRRGCSVSLAVLQEATARQQKQQEKLQKEQQLGASQLHIQKSRQQSFGWRQRQQPGPVQLVPIALHINQQFLQDVAAAVVQHNKAVQQEQLDNENAQQQQQQGPSLQDLMQRKQQLMRQGTSQHQQQHQQVPRVMVMPLLLQTLQAAAAATVIQSSWRAHRSRLFNRIAERALCNRAAVAIQRAWRAFLLKQRLRLLSTVSAAWQAGQRLHFSSIMCVNVASRRLVEAAAERSRLGQGMFPEQRLRFVIDNGGSVGLVDMADCSSTGCSSDGGTAAAADVIAGHGSQHINSSSSSGGGGASRSSVVPAMRVGLPKWLGVDIPIISAAAAAKILEDQVWFEPFGRADAGKLVEIGCDSKDLLAPSLIANPGLVHPTDVAQLVTFKSPQQAAARAALLAALTYSVKAQASCRLLSAQDSPLGAAYRSMTGCGTSSATGSTAVGTAASTMGSSAGGTAGSARVDSEAGTAAGASAARIVAGGVKFMQGLTKGANIISSSSSCGASATAEANPGAGGAAPCAATLATTDAAAPAAATSASFATAAAGMCLNGNDGGSAAAESGSSTARIAARTAAAYEERLAAEAAKAVETAMQALRVLEPDNPAPLHQLPLLPVKPTETLAAAAAAAAETAAGAAAAGDATGSLKTTAAGPAAGVVAVPGSVRFSTHLFHKLPHLQKLAAGMDAELMFGAAASAAAAGADSVKPTQAVAGIAANRVAAGATAHASAGAVCQNQGSEIVIDFATQPQTAVQLAVNLAEYITKVKQQQVESKLAADAAAAAAAAADAELAAKQQTVQVVRAAVAEGNPTKEPGSTHSAHCPAAGCWPESTAAAADLVRLQKQQQQQVAAAAAAALKEKEMLAQEELMRQQAAKKAKAQVELQMQAHALQQKLLQEEEQQQQAASSRVALLHELRKSGKAAAARRQEVAAALNTQCNMFSKHLKRGELAVVRAASSKAAAGHAAELRQTNHEAAALAQQKRQDIDGTCAAKAAQERQEAKLAFQAAQNVTELEVAARRATVAAQRLHEEQIAQSVGPAGGVWGSAKPDGVLRWPLRVTLVGTVDSSSATWTPDV